VGEVGKGGLQEACYGYGGQYGTKGEGGQTKGVNVLLRKKRDWTEKGKNWWRGPSCGWKERGSLSDFEMGEQEGF